MSVDRLKILLAHLLGSNCQLGLCREPTDAQGDDFIEVEYKARSGVNSRQQYEALYKESISQPARFWAKFAEEFYWHKKWDSQHVRYNFDVSKGAISTEFFRGGKTNVCFNALDRNVEEGRGANPCFLWEGSQPGDEAQMTYQEVLEEACRLANWLRGAGVKKGDAVCIYMPMLCQLPIAMLACARIGAVHSVVFGGFSAEALSQRIVECRSSVLITASGGLRGTKTVELKQIADAAVESAAKEGFKVSSVLVWEHGKAKPRSQTSMQRGRDAWWQDQVPSQDRHCTPEWMAAEDPLFLLFTSGSTGKPKGVVHTTGGFMVQAGVSARYVFDLQPGDIYWCTADCGWITGHTYITYGPLLNGVTQVLWEGVPTFPKPDRIWQIVEKHKVRQLYTSPTLIRALEAHGEDWVLKHDLSSLKILGSVGEPINAVAWNWLFEVVGKRKCPIVDTWWQTETGSIAITNLPGAFPMKRGCASLPFFGIQPLLMDEKGNKKPPGPGEGILALAQPWPSIMRTLKGDHARFEKAYFSTFEGSYFTGDGARRDKDGYIWITGRVDDVINVSGHRVGTAEVEAALCSNSECVEAAVVGIEHNVKGQALYAFITLSDDVPWNDEMKKKLVASVREKVGAFAAPETLHLAPGLPKTRSGKIMRRILRKIASKEEKELGDLSTLADPEVVQALIDSRGK